MTFSGRVTSVSHMGGLLISFEGRSPNLGDVLRINGGKLLGKVDTVLGPVDSGLVHVHPLFNNVDASRAVGSPVEIAPKKTKVHRGQKGSGKRNDKRGVQNRGRGRRDSTFSRGRTRGGVRSSNRHSRPGKRGRSTPRGKDRRRSR